MSSEDAASGSSGGGKTDESTATPPAPINDEQRRIWVGNLDARITEFQLLKLMQQCGPIDKFDMLFHKGGPMAGHSRGYAFVTFAQNEGAINALEKLDGTQVAGRPIAVRLAKNIKYDELERPKPRIEIPALGTGKREDKFSKSEAIRAIEAKLKMLERQTDDDLAMSMVGGSSMGGPGVSIIQRYQFNKDRDNLRTGHHATRGKYTKSSAPYNRNQRPKRR